MNWDSGYVPEDVMWSEIEDCVKIRKWLSDEGHGEYYLDAIYYTWKKYCEYMCATWMTMGDPDTVYLTLKEFGLDEED